MHCVLAMMVNGPSRSRGKFLVTNHPFAADGYPLRNVEERGWVEGVKVCALQCHPHTPTASPSKEMHLPFPPLLAAHFLFCNRRVWRGERMQQRLPRHYHCCAKIPPPPLYCFGCNLVLERKKQARSFNAEAQSSLLYT